MTKTEFDWNSVAWGRPDSPPRSLCSCCHGALPEVPLIMWNSQGYTAQFCDDCAEQAFAALKQIGGIK
jgi:hypothetical protein